MFSAKNILSVSEITFRIKKNLETAYRFISIRGEISNLKVPYSGHSYFTLKDASAQIRAVLFKGNSRYLKKSLEDGQQVVCSGRISVYEPRGDYQLIVDTVDHLGEGDLRNQFEQLKKKLAEEGLFDPELKRPLPEFPEHITVISSPTGAAIQDFLKICRTRHSSATISIFPVTVQGDRAASQIAGAIERINKEVATDVIVLCRGGGSLEDLWAFNEEIVARSIHASNYPVVTGIGHETDHTIADFCADMRGATPTGAAELIVPDTPSLKKSIAKLHRTLCRTLTAKITFTESRVHQQKRALGRFIDKIENATLRIDALSDQLNTTFTTGIIDKHNRVNHLLLRLEAQAPLTRIEIRQQKLQHLRKGLERQMEALLAEHFRRFSTAASLLNSVSPLSTLARGYSIVQTRQNEDVQARVVTDSRAVSRGDGLDITLHRGKLKCRVEDKTDD